MKISLLQVGKTDKPYLNEGINDYEERLIHYCSYASITIPAIKNIASLSFENQKQKEGEEILKRLNPTDHVVILDESGKEFTSEKFSIQLEKYMNSGIKSIVFIIGGPFGFSPAIKNRANDSIALSKMTFSHQMVRLIFVEQLYRGFTILRGEKYHHR